jgi:hypothetical protein
MPGRGSIRHIFFGVRYVRAVPRLILLLRCQGTQAFAALVSILSCVAALTSDARVETASKRRKELRNLMAYPVLGRPVRYGVRLPEKPKKKQKKKRSRDGLAAVGDAPRAFAHNTAGATEVH